MQPNKIIYNDGSGIRRYPAYWDTSGGIRLVQEEELHMYTALVGDVTWEEVMGTDADSQITMVFVRLLESCQYEGAVMFSLSLEGLA